MQSAAGAAEPEAEVDRTPVPVPRDDVNWAEFVQDPRDPITDEKWCVWTYAQSKDQYKSNPRFEKLVKLHRENYNKVPPFDFCVMMQNAYNELVRDFLMKPDPNDAKKMVRYRGPAWPARNIWNYPITTIVLPSAIREEVARTYMRVLTTMSDNQLFLRVPGGTSTTVCRTTLDAYNKTWNIARHVFASVDGARDSGIFSLV